MLRRLAFLAILGSASCAPSVRAEAKTLPSQPVVLLGGQSTDLPRLVSGRVAVVSLWATWCEACQKEVGALNRLSDAAAQADALVVGIALGESREVVEAFVRGHGVRYLQVLDQDFHLADALGQRDIPSTLVVDRDGRIVYRGDALDSRALAVFQRTVAEGQGRGVAGNY